MLWTLAASVAIALVWGLIRPERMYQYPYFMAAVFAVFILPQALALVRAPGVVPTIWVSNVLLMALLCLVACFIGYSIVPSRTIKRLSAVSMNQDRLLHGAIIFIIVAWYCVWQIGQMSDEETGGTQWTGIVTIYAFFAGLTFPALTISLTAGLRGSRLGWILVGISALPPLQAAILYGRRQQTAQLLLTVALTLYFQRRLVAPRTLIATGIISAMLVIPGIAAYRGEAKENASTAFLNVDWVGNFRSYLGGDSTSELRNAAMLMYVVSKYDLYQSGAGYWDQIVFRFVPAQLFGMSFKLGLMFYPNDRGIIDHLSNVGYAPPGGSTMTGLGDAFQQLGWLGPLFFLILGVISRMFWTSSLQRDSLLPQLFYISTATTAMRALTHQTADYFPGLLYNCIFIGIVALYAARRQDVSKRKGPLFSADPKRIFLTAPRNSNLRSGRSEERARPGVFGDRKRKSVATDTRSGN